MAWCVRANEVLLVWLSASTGAAVTWRLPGGGWLFCEKFWDASCSRAHGGRIGPKARVGACRGCCLGRDGSGRGASTIFIPVCLIDQKRCVEEVTPRAGRKDGSTRGALHRWQDLVDLLIIPWFSERLVKYFSTHSFTKPTLGMAKIP